MQDEDEEGKNKKKEKKMFNRPFELGFWGWYTRNSGTFRGIMVNKLD